MYGRPANGLGLFGLNGVGSHLALIWKDSNGLISALVWCGVGLRDMWGGMGQVVIERSCSQNGWKPMGLRVSSQLSALLCSVGASVLDGSIYLCGWVSRGLVLIGLNTSYGLGWIRF